jgi:membrane-bound lytic murein transglycosylase B
MRRFVRKYMLSTLGLICFGAASAHMATVQSTSSGQARPTQTLRKPPAVTTAPVAALRAYNPAGFETYKAYLMQRALAAGVSDATIQSYVPTLQMNQRAIDLDRAQIPAPTPATGPEPLTPYLQKHITAALVSTGQRRYYFDWPTLLTISQRYGVDPAILMAIYGQETHYGSVTGNFDVLEALASLAYDGRRSAMFEEEFLSALKLIDNGVAREQLKGSYAGATGYPQFMPSLALRMRADGDGDGYSDIWSNEADALASIANVLQKAGWKPGKPWGTLVRVPASLDREAILSRTEAQRCPAVFRRHSRWMTVSEWRRLGVTVAGQPIPDNELTTLLEPNGPDGTGYLLTSNYRAILSYNCSNYYAMSVGILSDAIARRGNLPMVGS